MAHGRWESPRYRTGSYSSCYCKVLTPIFDPQFSEHSYGFRPGRSAQDAVQARSNMRREERTGWWT